MLKTPLYGFSDTSYKAIGEEVGVRALVDRFYSIMASQDDYQPLFNLHPGDLDTTKDKLFRFLMGWMGGERTYQAAYGSLNIPMAHAHLNVTPALVENWLNCMRQALAELGHEAEFSDYLIQQLAIPAERIRLVSQQHQNNA
ncbi:MAG TPA: globin [Oceanospirillaceae bacterium]|nr:globin [Oceanospirillaceae bacterium]